MRKGITIAVVVLAIAVLSWQISENASARTLLGDFHAFYCGGTVVLHGQNPYADQPILGCEQVRQPFGLYYARDNVALPAPFPGYALAFYAFFALLPYPLAAALWLTLLIACTLWGASMIARLTGCTEIGIVALLAVGYAVAVLPYGELAPLILCVLCGLSLVLRSSRPGALVFLLILIGVLALALLPHVALPVFIALFIWMPRARVPLLAAGAILLGVDLAIGGPGTAISYFTRVLPDHAASEIGFITQFSATWLASALGAPDRLALLIGKLSYAVMIIAGIWSAGALAKKFRDPAFLVLVPAAFAVIFGPFIHYSEITLALPATMLLFSHASGRAKSLAMAGAILVAFPWQSVVTQPVLIFPFTIGVIGIACVTLGLPLRTGLRLSLGAAIFCAICIVVAWQLGPANGLHGNSLTFDPTLAEASWAHHIAAKTSSGGVVWWLPKIPTWAGLLALAASALSLTCKNRISFISIEDAPLAPRLHQGI